MVPRKISLSLFFFSVMEMECRTLHKLDKYHTIKLILSPRCPAFLIQHFLIDSALTHCRGGGGYVVPFEINFMLVRPQHKNAPLQTGISASEWRGNNLKPRNFPACPEWFPTCPAAPPPSTLLSTGMAVLQQADVSELERAVFSFSGVWATFEVGKKWRTSLSIYLYLQNHRDPRW